MNTKDKLLISLRIKGFAKPAPMADAFATTPEQMSERFGELKASGLAEDTKVGLRLTPVGRETADAILRAERSAVDIAILETAGERFTPINHAFKQLITRWQMREIGGKLVRNDHADAAYDKTVLDELAEVHREVAGLIDAVAMPVPRFSDYARRLSAALAKIRDGEHRYVAAPDAESYHTIWFELHQDLIGLMGTTRAKEAAAGRAV